MGTWGAGNFQSDSALDHTGEFMGEIVGRIVQSTDTILGDENRRALDEDGDGVVMPDMDILSVLIEHCYAQPPRLDIITRWRDQFIAVFNDEIHDLSLSEEYSAERRAVVEGTFLKLTEQAQAYWQRYHEATIGIDQNE